MGGSMRKMGVYLGLLEDGEYSEYDEPEQPVRRARRSPSNASAPAPRMPHPSIQEDTGEVARLDDRRRTAAQPVPAAPAVSAPSASVAALSRITTLHPRTYNEARVIGENYRDGVPVIMNLTEMSDDDAKRLVDFAAGLVFATRGTIERVTNKVFLLSPPNVSVAAEDKQRIAENGFFNQS